MSTATMSPMAPPTVMMFPDAMAAVIEGKKVQRQSWGNTDCIFLVGGRLSLRKSDGSLHQLLVSDGDMYGEDWVVVREN